MSFAIVSDIHLDVNEEYPIVEELITYLEELGVDGLIIAGDISNHYKKTIDVVQMIKEELNIEVMYVPGNHDMWSHNLKELPTNVIYYKYLNDVNCLCYGSRQISDNITVIGDIGWYDYSFGSKEFGRDDFELMSYEDRRWQDSMKNAWTKNNVYFCNFFLERLRKQLQECKTETKIVVTHMLPIEEFTVKDTNKSWDYFNAFLGSKKLHDLYREFNVTHAVCGHVHYRMKYHKDGINYYCPCLNYASEWQGGVNNCREEIRNAVQIIDC